MPRYYFDFRDNDILIVDDTGTDLTDREAAKTEAANTLADLVHRRLAESDSRRFSIQVRTEDGSQIAQAQLDYRIS